MPKFTVHLARNFGEPHHTECGQHIEKIRTRRGNWRRDAQYTDRKTPLQATTDPSEVTCNACRSSVSYESWSRAQRKAEIDQAKADQIDRRRTRYTMTVCVDVFAENDDDARRQAHDLFRGCNVDVHLTNVAGSKAEPVKSIRSSDMGSPAPKEVTFATS